MIRRPVQRTARRSGSELVVATLLVSLLATGCAGPELSTRASTPMKNARLTLRVARHTDDLDRIEAFYVGVLGLQVLGRFEDHDGYDGLFLGRPELDWHLEFTTCARPAQHRFDEDDLLVIYPHDREEHAAMRRRIEESGLVLQTPANPYWREHGLLVRDPDGHGVILSAQRFEDGARGEPEVDADSAR